MTVGLSLTIGISGVLNFAHGALYMLAGYIAWQLLNSLGLPYALAAIIAVIASGVLGALVYWLVLVRVRGLMLSEIIVTFALGIGILELLRWSGFTGFRYSLPTFMEGSIEIADVIVDYQRLFIIGIGVALVLALWLLAHHSRIGLAFRAIAQNERTALAYGIESDQVAMLSVALGAALAAVAAITILPLGIISIDRGYDVLIIAFAVAIVGGLESITGMILASFVLGYAQVSAAAYLGTHWVMIVNLLAIILVLVIKPSGLFGKSKELEERV
ncbi:High-affinity branched-chain amino acid transport system permease protein LivH [subsurface metagenome]